jgi:ribosome-associated protein
MKEKIVKNITYPIRLGQFLKLINAAQDGIEAKIRIQEGAVRVNGEIEKRRGKQLRKDDVVEFPDDIKYLLK